MAFALVSHLSIDCIPYVPQVPHLVSHEGVPPSVVAPVVAGLAAREGTARPGRSGLGIECTFLASSSARLERLGSMSHEHGGQGWIRESLVEAPFQMDQVVASDTLCF